MTFAADILVEGETIKEVRAGIAPAPAHKHWMRPACWCFRVELTHIRTSTCLSAGTTSSDDFETGTRAAAIGGTTSIVDLQFKRAAPACAMLWIPGGKKAQGKACIDYGLHMIVTDLAGADSKTWTKWLRKRGELQAFHGLSDVLMVDDATIFKALKQTSKNGALICMHAENGSVIDVIVQQALAEGKTAAPSITP